MTASWPEHILDDSKLEDAFQLAQTFELHCAKVYSHAAAHPDSAPSAHYVMELVSQAYRAVHSLHMQKIATAYLDLGAATAALETKAKEYRDATADNDATPGVELAEDQTEQASGTGLVDLLNGDFDDDEEEDSDWEESEEETDDEYYEYSEGSESDSELEEIARGPQINTAQAPEESRGSSDEKARASNATTIQTATTKEDTPPASITQDQAMHDRITAALQNLSLPSDEPEDIPLSRVETHIDPAMTDLSRVETHLEPAMTNLTISPTHITFREDTAVRVESRQEPTLEHCATAPAGGARKPSLGSSSLQRKISMRSSPGRLSRRLKTVCYKYAGKAMVPIRGKVN